MSIDVNIDDVSDLIQFLDPFDLGGSRETPADISSHRFESLMVHCAFKPDDSAMVQSLKAVAQVELAPLKAVQEIDKCKGLVTYLNQAGLNTRLLLPHTAKQEVCTRWNSQLTMLRSVATEWDEVSPRHNA